MVTNRASKLVFVVTGCALALLIGVLPAMAWAPQGTGLSEKPQIDQSSLVSQSHVDLQQAVVLAPQDNISAAPSAVAPAAASTNVAVHADPVAQTAAPAGASPAITVSQPAPAAPDSMPALSVVSEQSQPQAFSTVAVSPSPSHEGEVEFTGKIASITGTLPNLTLIIGEHTVRTDSQTLISGTLDVNVTVEVKGTAQPDGSILASRIKVDDQGDDEGEVEFRGPIIALPADPGLNGDWVVGNYTVTVNLTTTVVPSRTAAVLGAIAEVNALRQSDGSLLAVKIKIENEHEFENEVEFKGMIADLTGSGPYTMTVAGHTVKTDAHTEIDGILANGVLVEVKGMLQSDGTVLASQIKVEDQTQPAEVEFTARITGTLPPGLIGVWTFDNGKTVTVTTSTLIDQSHGAIGVGALVEVKALKQPDNSLVAVRVQVEDQ